MKKLLYILVFLTACATQKKATEPAPLDDAPACETPVPKPPVAEREPHETKIHGETLVDPYFWLRDREDDRVVGYLEAENAYTARMTEHTAKLRAELFEEMRSHIEETDVTAPYRMGEYFYYSRTEEGKDYEIHCRKKGSLDAPEEVLLDENAMAADHDYFALGAVVPSPDHRLLAYSVDTVGNERFTMYVKDLETGELLTEEIQETYYSAAWANDGKTLFYTRVDDANRPHRLFRHRLGDSPEKDELVFEEPDERFFLSIDRTRSDAMLLLTLQSAVTTEVHYMPADEPAGEFRLIHPRQQDVEYYVEHHSDRFFIVTNEDAVNFRLFETPVDETSRDTWNEVLPHRDDVTLRSVDAFADHLVIWERREGLPHVRVRDLRSGEEHALEFPESAYSAWIGDNYTFDTTVLRFEYTSMATPHSVYDYDMDTRKRRLVKQREVPGYDPKAYETGRLQATAPDGTQVPVTVAWRNGAREDGPAPLVLYGYGSYGASYDPRFSATRLALLDRGVILAIAHVRGGGEKGRKWYESGKYLKKRNTFTDFIAVAEHLVDEGWTAPDRLGISGRSAGGLLMGAVMNMRPDLFEAVVAGVPFVDVVNTMLDPSIPLTVIEWEEWGNPKEREYFEYIRSYSPYDNVTTQEYPNTLITAGLNDPRVAYWEPAKWTAKLRAEKTGDSTLLLKTNMGAGHGGASGRYAYLEEIAFTYAFLLEHLGVVEPPRCAP